jgi:hypothetical protein
MPGDGPPPGADVGDPIGEADSLFFINHLYLLTGNAAAGAAAARSLAELAVRYQLVSYGVWAQFIAAHHFGRTGHVEQTISALDAALALVEENISWLARQRDFRGICAFGRPALYERLLELYTEKKDFRAAFQTAERAKAAARWPTGSGRMKPGRLPQPRKVSGRSAPAAGGWRRRPRRFGRGKPRLLPLKKRPEKCAAPAGPARPSAMKSKPRTRGSGRFSAPPRPASRSCKRFWMPIPLFCLCCPGEVFVFWAIHQNRIVQEKLPLSEAKSSV